MVHRTAGVVAILFFLLLLSSFARTLEIGPNPAYTRREYKKRFARMKAGTMAADDFYTWSEKAREKKVECEAGKLTREKFLKRV